MVIALTTIGIAIASITTIEAAVTIIIDAMITGGIVGITMVMAITTTGATVTIIDGRRS